MQNQNFGFKIKIRVIFTAFMFLFQIALILTTVLILQKDFIYIYSLIEFLGVITAVYIVNKPDNPSYKIAWIVFILLLPVFGLLVYLLWGGQRTFPHLKKKMRKCEQNFKRYLSQDKEISELINYETASLARQAHYLSSESGFPVYGSTSVEYLSPGEYFYTKLIEELNKAKKYIFIEFFIIAEGEMWNGIKEVLYKKAEEGVDIKIIFDDFGSIKRQSKDFIQKQRAKGLNVSIFNPIKPPFNIFMNNRNHRKMVVIDGNVAFTGGINIADEYINKLERFGYWMDSAVMLKGKAVDSFVVMFAIMWEYITGKQLRMPNYLLSREEQSKSYVLPYCDGPMDMKNTAQGIYMQILNTAHRYVYIATPYLILDNNMLNALKMAAESGVDVRIITPYIPDKKYVHPATQFHYSELLDAGIRIFEYTPGFMHSKLFISDDSVATVGSVNMDFRSFIFHFECGVWFTDNAAIGEMKGQFKSLCERSTEILPEKWKKRNIFKRIKQWFFHLFAPLM